jgi:hypothetical protein
MDGISQFAVSSGANIATLVVLAVLYVCKRKCEHSKCKIHNSCIDVELSHSDSEDDKDDACDLQRQVKNILQKMHIGNDQSVPVKHSKGPQNV